MVLELKNDLKIAGTLQSVDENLNFYLSNMKVVDDETNPYLVRSLNKLKLLAFVQEWLHQG